MSTALQQIPDRKSPNGYGRSINTLIYSEHVMTCFNFLIVTAQEPDSICLRMRVHTSATATTLQSSAKGLAPRLLNFVPAIAYHFCVAYPAAFTQPFIQAL